jgi:GMP synthase-like glutamine amidotransferase
LGEWATARSLSFEVHTAFGAGEPPAAAEFDWIAVLGSKFTPLDDSSSEVRRGRAVVEDALAADVPVLGLCFGGQLLASVLGGAIEALPRPELGWARVESKEPAAVPDGPWLSWHWYRFETPPGAEELARNAVGAQAFRQGPHLGVQFHPESTIEVVAGWADHDRGRLQSEGVEDPIGLLEQGRRYVGSARRQAWQLFDHFASGAAAAPAVGRGEERDGAA